MLLITHDGVFHYDEVLATVVLLKIYPDAEIIRTRKREIIESGDIVYDVGRVFNIEKNRYDHHQSSFRETFSPNHYIKLSSSGLIYKYFGEQFLNAFGIDQTNPHYQKVFVEVYEQYFMSADAIDNGYEIFGEIVPRSMSHIIHSFNLLSTVEQEETLENQDNRFLEAVKFVRKDLDNFMKNIVNNWLPGYAYLEQIIKNATDDIIELDKYVLVDLVLEIEKKYQKDIKFILKVSENSTQILAVPQKKGHFGSKVCLKASWRGLVGDRLCEISQIPDCNFVHSNGFYGSNKTREGAIKMCRESIDEHNRQMAGKEV